MSPQPPSDSDVRPRLLYVTQRLDLRGGGEQYLLALLHAFSTRYRVHLFSFIDGPLGERLADELRGIRWRRLNLQWVGGLKWLWTVRLLIELVVLIRRWRIEIVHAQSGYANLIAGLAARLAGVPCIVATMHGTNLRYAYRSFNGRLSRWHAWFYAWVDRLTALMAHRLIAPSQSVQTYLVQQLGIYANRVEVISNGIDGAMGLPDGASRERVRRELGVDQTAPVIGMVGHLFPVKGHCDFLAAARQLAVPWSRAVFWIVGGVGNFRPDALYEQAAPLMRSGRLQLLGDRRDVAALLGAMDVVVVPSRSEGLPYIVLEAFACERPVVACEVGGIPEVIRHDETGLLVPPANPAALAEAIGHLLSNPAAAQRMARNGRAVVLERFSRDLMIEATDRVYRTLLGSRKRPSCAAFGQTIELVPSDAPRQAVGRTTG